MYILLYKYEIDNGTTVNTDTSAINVALELGKS